ncbi:MAG TPA: hypothetical protein VMM18_12135 [Gemmatimonadaceae bacterium]|nr:hypothetical protein [Gemmatimonadaceae bacterium]
MRHLIANIVTYTIGALLVVGAALFAWMRSSQVAITDEETIVAAHAPRTEPGFDWEELGRFSYERNCRNCHLADGQGWDQYPSLGLVGTFLADPGGREWLLDLHIYGLASERWRVPMPPMGHVPDVELAAVINHLLHNFGNEPSPAAEDLIMPEDVAARRGLGLTPREVELRRPER